MSQPYRLHKAYPLNEFTSRCGYFWPGSPVNNGYGCMHPEQEEIVGNLGRCFASSCPLAYEQDPGGDDGGSDYVVTYRRTPELLPTPTPGNRS